jgi:hypothetical protein
MSVNSTSPARDRPPVLVLAGQELLHGGEDAVDVAMVVEVIDARISTKRASAMC